MLGVEKTSPSVERLPAVMARTGMRKSWIYKEVAQGRFPAPVRLASNAVGWLSREIDAWLANKIAERAIHV